MEGVQDGVAAAPSGTGKSKLETLPREDLIKFAKKQMMLLQKAKARCTELDKEIEELKSKPVDGRTDDIIKVLSERLDSLLLDKAESEQQCLCLKKENDRMKQEVEDFITKLEDKHKEFEKSHKNYVNEIESLKNELIAVHSEHSKDKASLQQELEEAVNKQLELLAQLKSQSDSEDNVKQLQEEIQNITARFEEQILCLQKQLEATSDEKKQEIIHLQKVIEENTQHYQKDINTFQEEILQLRAAHKEVNELVFQMETSAKEHEAEINKIKDNRVQQCEGSESNQEKYHCESKNLNEGTSDASQENQHHSVPLQEDTFGEQTVYDKVRQLEDSLKELESQHSILKDEVTYMNNLKLKLEMEAQHIKDEFFHEREDLEFKINELLLAKEEHGYIVEKLKYEQEDLNRQLCCAVEQHNKEIQRLQEIHQKEISELSETFISGSEKEKLALMFEIQGLKEQCENLQHEKQEAILNYESLREMMEILQTELGESAGKISQEFESMKQQQASDVHELQQKLRTAFNEKDTLLETVNRLQQENKKLFSYQELVPELESIIKSLKVDNSMYLANLGQKDTILQELEAKISSLAEEKNEFVSKMKTCHEEIDKLHQKWEKEQRLTVELKEAAEQTTQHNSVLRQRVDELTRKLDEILREKSQNDQSIMVQIKTMTEDQEALSSKIEFLYEENNRLLSEKVQLSRDLETLQSQRDFSYSKSNTLRNRVTELEGKLQLMVEEQENLNKVFENEQVQKSFVKTQLYGYLKQMGQNILEENEEEDVVKVLQAVGESLAKIKEEKHNLVFEYDERILELERKIKCLQEENVVQHEKLTALLRDSEQVKIVLQKESEETTSTEETLQLNLLEIKNANEKTSLENQVLLAEVEDLSQALHSQNEVYNEKLLVIEHENLKLLLEQRESELQDVRAELILLKDSLEKSPSVKNNQLSLVKELEEKIESLEKESKDKDEKISKIKLVAVKAKKELDSNRKEVQTLREELESVRSEKDRLSTSMKEFIQGAENYKNLLLEYDKQSEQLDVEKERANNLEHHIEDLTKQLRNSTCQYEKLNSDNEDLLARIETLQSNARLLEAQILEVQKAKGIVDKELESEKLQKEQKIKEHVSIVNELEELQLQFEKEKKQLQKTMQELELVKKDAQQTTLMNMEIADYERLMKELNQKLTSKNSKIEDLEQEIKTQKQKQETLQEEMTSLQSSVQHYEEKNTKIKQLLVKTKKELADSKQAETDHLLLQASLKGELEASQQQVEVYKIQLAEITSEKHKIHEHLKTSAEQHQRTLSAYQQRVAALQEESRTAKEEQAAVTSEFESYKVRVHNVLKQQKNKSVSQAETEGAKQERKHLEMLIDQLKIKLQDSQNSLQINVSELQTLQSEHDTLLERHNRMLQETVTKEAELREKLCSVQSKNTMMKSEHSQAVCQLTSQNEALRNSFRDQVRHLQEEHRKTVETLQHQLSKVEAQLFQLKSEPSTRSTYPASSHQPLKNPRERRNTDLPLLDMHTVAREEGEGMETTDSESVSSAGTHIPSLEQLLSSPDTKPEQHLAEPSLWHAEFTKEELAEKLSSTTKSADHLNGLLRETEATNAILMEQIKLLKNEIRRLERNQEREKSVANLEYLKNVLLRFIFLKPGSERERLLPVIDTMLQLSPEEKGKLATVAQGEEDRSSRSSGWASYLHSWSGLR